MLWARLLKKIKIMPDADAAVNLCWPAQIEPIQIKHETDNSRRDIPWAIQRRAAATIVSHVVVINKWFIATYHHKCQLSWDVNWWFNRALGSSWLFFDFEIVRVCVQAWRITSVTSSCIGWMIEFSPHFELNAQEEFTAWFSNAKLHPMVFVRKFTATTRTHMFNMQAACVRGEMNRHHGRSQESWKGCSLLQSDFNDDPCSGSTLFPPARSQATCAQLLRWNALERLHQRWTSIWPAHASGQRLWWGAE